LILGLPAAAYGGYKFVQYPVYYMVHAMAKARDAMGLKPYEGHSQLATCLLKVFTASEITDEEIKNGEFVAKMRNVPSFSMVKRNPKTETRKVKNGDFEVPFFWTPHNDEESKGEFKLVVLYAHGGGLVTGSADMETGASEAVAQTMADKIDGPVLVVSPDYRYMPDFSMDTIVSDTVALYQHLVEDQGYDPSIIRLYGTSGGGIMTLLSLLKIVNEGKLAPPGAVYSGSPGGGLEHLDGFEGWENSEEWARNVDKDGNGWNKELFVFSRQVAKSFGDQWSEDDKALLKSWVSNQEALKKIKKLHISYGTNEMFAAPIKNAIKVLQNANVDLHVTTYDLFHSSDVNCRFFGMVTPDTVDHFNQSIDRLVGADTM
jgi:acetyl esterase/lipase